MLNKSLIFSRSWAVYKVKLNHGIKADFATELKHCYKIAKLLQKYKH
jgi:hypothetical protein